MVLTGIIKLVETTVKQPSENNSTKVVAGVVTGVFATLGVLAYSLGYFNRKVNIIIDFCTYNNLNFIFLGLRRVITCNN